MVSGEMTVCDFKLTKDDIVVKREFSGDSKVRNNSKFNSKTICFKILIRRQFIKNNLRKCCY